MHERASQSIPSTHRRTHHARLFFRSLRFGSVWYGLVLPQPHPHLSVDSGVAAGHTAAHVVGGSGCAPLLRRASVLAAW